MTKVAWADGEVTVQAEPGYRIHRIVFFPQLANSVVWNSGDALVRCVVVRPVERTARRCVLECEWLEEVP